MDKPRIFYLDYLRVVATCAVILTHTAAYVVTAQEAIWGDLLSNANIANLYDTLSRFAVNIFFMISGALLLNPAKNFNLKKQSFKIFWPLAFWSVFYVLVNIIRKDMGLKLYWSNYTDPLQAFLTFFQHELVTPLWFVYSLMACYLALPLLRCATSQPNPAQKKLLHYLMIIGFLSTVVLPTLQHFWPNFRPGLQNIFLPFFLFLFVTGYYLHTYPIKINPKILVAVWLVTNLAMFFIIYFERSHGLKTNWAWGNSYPFVFFNSLAIFLWFKCFYNTERKIYSWVKKLSALSFHTYLAHAMVLGYVFDLWPETFAIKLNALWAISLAWLITTVISFFVAFLIFFLGSFVKNNILKR